MPAFFRLAGLDDIPPLWFCIAITILDPRCPSLASRDARKMFDFVCCPIECLPARSLPTCLYARVVWIS